MNPSYWGIILGGLISAGSGAGTMWLAQWLQQRRELRLKEMDASIRFRERQMNSLYAPILSGMRRIQAITQIRSEIGESMHKWWEVDVVPYIQHRPEERQKSETEAIDKSIAYDNKQLESVIYPAWKGIADIFTEHYALAEEELRAFYPDFLRYVEIWERSLSKDHPREPLRHVKHEVEFMPRMYRHVEDRTGEILKTISKMDHRGKKRD